MTDKAESKDFIWDFFTSIKLSFVLLLTLAGTSIIGTIIVQNKSHEYYHTKFGDTMFGDLVEIFDKMGLFDMYHAKWFQFLLLLLTINIVVCSIDRLSTTLRLAFPKDRPINPNRYRKLENKQSFNTALSVEQAGDIINKTVSGSYKIRQTGDGFIFAEKGGWTRLGVYVVHLSIVILIAGGLMGSILGFEGYVNITEGDTIDSIEIQNSEVPKKLDFSVKCEKFVVDYYDTGTVKEFRSSLVVIEDGKEVLKKDIVVNTPLRYKGINFFQSSYGEIPGNITLSFTSKESGMVYPVETKAGETIDIPEGLGKLEVVDYRPSFGFKGHNIGPSILGIIHRDKEQPIYVVMPMDPNKAKFDFMRQGKVAIVVDDYQSRSFTGLQVSSDPGLPIVYTSFILMLVGFFIAFYMSHKKVFVEVTKKGNSTRVLVSGNSNKNKIGMDETVKMLAESLEKKLAKNN